MSTLTIVCGLPGAGKTVVAKLLSRRQGAELLRSDVLRKERAAAPAYDENAKQAIYETLFERAGIVLGDGKDVVLDAAFDRRANRLKAAALAATFGAGFEIVEVTASEAVTKNRLHHRQGDESDADWRVYLLLKRRFERIDQPHVTLVNDSDLENLEQQVRKLFSQKSI